MLKKLRLKFIISAISSVTIFLGLILMIVNLINYSNVADQADMVTSKLIEEGGKFNPEFKPNDEFIPKDFNDERKEMRFDTRYFSVKLTKKGEIIATNINTISYTEAEAQEFALSVYENYGKTGWLGDFRYRVSEKVDGEVIVVAADFSRELAPSRTVLYTSLIVFGAGLLLSLIFLIGISNIVINPVKDAIEKQKEFISNASHELKTPLTVISANNELIEIRDGESEETDTISRQIRKLSMLVKSLNNLANIDEIDKIVEFKKINLSNLLTESIEPFKELFNKDGKELSLNIEKDIEYKGNESYLKELFSIIIENAYKYTKSKAEISLKLEENRITILEKNDGEDIKDGNLDEIFERFYRSDDVRAKAIEGSGLGLSIAKEIVSLHGGRIKAKGEDSNFVIKVEL